MTTSGVNLRSIDSAHDYLVNALRIDETALKELDSEAIWKWLPDSPKMNSLSNVLKMIKVL